MIGLRGSAGKYNPLFFSRSLTIFTEKKMGKYVYIVDSSLDGAIVYDGAFSTKKKAMEAVDFKISLHLNDGWRIKEDDSSGKFFLERYVELVRRGRTGNRATIRITKLIIR